MSTDRPEAQRIQDPALLLAILDHLPTSIFAKDEQLRFVYSNDAHCEMIGQTEETLLGLSDSDFYPAAEAAAFLSRDRKVIEEGITLEAEETATGASGHTADVLTRKTRLTMPDGRRFLIGTNTDLTEMRKREEQYRALAQTVPVGVWHVDETGRTSFANPRFLAYFGIDSDDVNRLDIAAMLGGGRGDFPGQTSRFETDLMSAKGEERRVLVISSGWLALSADGLRSAIVSVVDISEMTELKRVNDEISRLNRELAENMRKLKDAQDENLRRQQLSQLGQLTATVAHEIRNPLGAVRTAAFLMERKLKDKGLGVEQQLMRIANGINRCDAIISQLLDFSRVRSLQAEPVALDEWLSRLVAEEAERLPAMVTIECDLGLGAQPVEIDTARMIRVIVNLLSNATEAMVGKGDDPQKVVTAEPRIVVATRRAGAFAEISVSDNGPGMSEDILEKVLEPLFTTKSFGTGLGLPAVEKIMQDHNGGLRIASRSGEGTVVTAFLPLAQSKAGAA